MIKFIKNLLSKREQSIFNVTIKPYIISSATILVCIGLCSQNEDMGAGLFISWFIYTVVELCCIMFSE